MLLLPLPVEMKPVEGDENTCRDKMERCRVKRKYDKEGFVCIPLEEMESYYRHSQCCHQLQESELLCVWCVSYRSVSGRSSLDSFEMEILTIKH